MIWRRQPDVLARLWSEAMSTLEVDSAGYTLSGLRPGGATFDYLRYCDIARLRWRGAWRQERTLENYLQESMVWLAQTSWPSEARTRIARSADADAGMIVHMAGGVGGQI